MLAPDAEAFAAVYVSVDFEKGLGTVTTRIPGDSIDAMRRCES